MRVYHLPQVSVGKIWPDTQKKRDLKKHLAPAPKRPQDGSKWLPFARALLYLESIYLCINNTSILHYNRQHCGLQECRRESCNAGERFIGEWRSRWKVEGGRSSIQASFILCVFLCIYMCVLFVSFFRRPFREFLLGVHQTQLIILKCSIPFLAHFVFYVYNIGLIHTC